MTAWTDIRPISTASPLVWRRCVSLVSHLINSWIAGVIARCEREAALAAMRQLDDRELKDMGIRRCQLGDAFNQIARERTRLQRCRQSC